MESCVQLVLSFLVGMLKSWGGKTTLVVGVVVSSIEFWCIFALVCLYVICVHMDRILTDACTSVCAGTGREREW